MKLTSGQAGFIKGVALALVTALLGYLGNEANLTAIVSLPIAGLIAGLASALESHIKAENGTALFGAAQIK